MPSAEQVYGVWLQKTYVGTLRQRGDFVRFAIHPEYAEDPMRPVLGLVFEQDLTRVHSSALQLPPWFSNLLPEGAQRGWIARHRGVSDQREMELLAEVGHDLPGAVSIWPLPVGAVPDAAGPVMPAPPVALKGEVVDPRGRFSLAGVQLKLSMVMAGDRLVVPLGGAVGDWIVKFPDATFPSLPVVEHATMELARRAGIDVPEIRLVGRDQLPDTPTSLWTSAEDVAYAIRRFDRDAERAPIHIEDLAQARDVRPRQKYEGRYESVAALVHRGVDHASLLELVRRLALSVLVDNSDAHLKNFSLLYSDPRSPVLAPAYDLVSVAPYDGYGGDLALSLAGNRRADEVRLEDFAGLGRRLGVDGAEIVSVAEETVRAAVEAWSSLADDLLADHGAVRAAVDGMITARAASLRS